MMSVAATVSTREQFGQRLSRLAKAIGDRPLDKDLAEFLNRTFPPDGDDFLGLAGLIKTGAEEGWVCAREAGGIKFGRAVKAGAEAGRFSVDVVHMSNVKGPHHIHPEGEIGMIAPTAGEPKFDAFGRGWYVYGPGSSHWPTLTGGSAYVLYLLPNGSIEFTGR